MCSFLLEGLFGNKKKRGKISLQVKLVDSSPLPTASPKRQILWKEASERSQSDKPGAFNYGDNASQLRKEVKFTSATSLNSALSKTSLLPLPSLFILPFCSSVVSRQKWLIQDIT